MPSLLEHRQHIQCGVLILFAMQLAACGVFKPSPKSNLTDGFYKQKTSAGKQRVYVDIMDNDIQLSALDQQQKPITVPAVFPLADSGASARGSLRVSKPSLDIDFLTIPLKYRPANAGVPAQLNANLNGAAFLGYRTDQYTIRYAASPFSRQERHVDHFGYSVGIFSGIGNTFMSPTNTMDRIQQEYDGVVWNKGVAAMFAINNFTIGLAIGVDHLLDKNKAVWIYQGKVWYGLSFGLNLN